MACGENALRWYYLQYDHEQFGGETGLITLITPLTIANIQLFLQIDHGKIIIAGGFLPGIITKSDSVGSGTS